VKNIAKIFMKYIINIVRRKYSWEIILFLQIVMIRASNTGAFCQNRDYGAENLQYRDPGAGTGIIGFLKTKKINIISTQKHIFNLIFIFILNSKTYYE
jgi:hypothetical protein